MCLYSVCFDLASANEWSIYEWNVVNFGGCVANQCLLVAVCVGVAKNRTVDMVDFFIRAPTNWQTSPAEYTGLYFCKNLRIFYPTIQRVKNSRSDKLVGSVQKRRNIYTIYFT